MSSEEKVTLEEMFESLDQLISKMENPDATLDESFKLYKDGLEKLKACNEMLDTVEKEIKVINAEGQADEF